jgi:hypothetical protein
MDPDGVMLSYKWWHYDEADRYQGSVEIIDANKKNAAFTVLQLPESTDIHIIHEVKANKIPCLTSYKRIIITNED